MALKGHRFEVSMGNTLNPKPWQHLAWQSTIGVSPFTFWQAGRHVEENLDISRPTLLDKILKLIGNFSAEALV